MALTITFTEGKFDFTQFNDMLTHVKPSAGTKVAIARSLMKDVLSSDMRYRAMPLIELGYALENEIETYSNARKIYTTCNIEARTNKTIAKTWSAQELVQAAKIAAHVNANASLVAEQTESNRGRPELTVANQSTSADAGKVA